MNDGSTDNSEVAAGVCGKDARFVYVEQRIKGSLLHEIPEWNMLPGIIWHFWTVDWLAENALQVLCYCSEDPY
ncbi:MAG: hypothetical protein ACLRTD_24815 [Bacteroides sp.]